MDIGCGLGDSLEYIENPVYFGYDISKTYIEASKFLWAMRKNDLVKKESSRVLKKHTNQNRKAFQD